MFGDIFHQDFYEFGRFGKGAKKSGQALIQRIRIKASL